jgi:hypothetical protein
MGGYFRPLVCAAATFKNFMIVPLKDKSFAHNCRQKWQTADLWKRPVSSHRTNRFAHFYPPSCGGANRKRKIGSLAVPVVAASQIAFSRGADRIHLKSGVGIPQMNQTVEPRTGY